MSEDMKQAGPAELSNEIAGPPALIVDPSRVEETVKLLLMGHRDFDVLAAVAEMWPDQEIGPLVKAAVSDLMRSANAPQNMVRGWAIEAAKAIYRKSIEAGEYGEALKAVKVIVDLTERA